MPISLAPCRPSGRLSRPAAAFILVASLHAWPAPSAAQAVGAGRLSTDDPGAAMQAEVQRLIGRAACNDDAQCRTLPLGARACGGPESFVAWSVLGTDQAALQRAAARYTQWQAQEQARRGAMSICMVETDPGAVCSKPAPEAGSGMGRCVLRSAAADGVTR